MKPDELERLQKYFDELERLMPNPLEEWDKDLKPCKWLKMLEERKQKNPDAPG